MLNLGTLNFHRAHNYGALLVAYSLKTWLRNQGYNAHCIDYWPEYHDALYKSVRPKIDEFINGYILSENIDTANMVYDCVVYGSDTIWKKLQFPEKQRLDTVYLADGTIKSKRHIAFSASTVLERMDSECGDTFRKYLINFDAISVREETFQQYIQSFTHNKTFHTCDPTLLLTLEEWDKIIPECPIGTPYCFLYNQQFSDMTTIAMANALTEKTGYPTYILDSSGILHSHKGERIISEVSPTEFLSLIKHSEYVLAASFHGVVLSTLFQKQFSVIMKVAADRAISYLNTVGLSDRLITHSSEICINDKMDYTVINARISEFILRSKEYLKLNIK